MKIQEKIGGQQLKKKQNILKQINKKQSYLLKYDIFKSQWKQQNPNQLYQCLCPWNKDITTITLNVLFDRQGYNQQSQFIINSRLRYNYILNKVGTILPDIITFNEVTPLFNQMLKSCNWAQQHYWISQFTVKMGNVILSKIKPISVEKFYVSKCPRPIQGIFLPIKISQERFKVIAFFSVHLTAYEKNVQRRTQQFNDLINYLKRYSDVVEDFVLQGDMNFHSQTEKSIFLKHQLRDAWLQNYDLQQNPGYTFNSAENSLINEVYWGFQKRKMRLDRILLKGTSIKCQQIKVNFNEPIYIQKNKEEVNHYNILKGALLFVNDLIGSKFLRKKEKESYLFPSDHFGLIATLRILNN